MIVMLQSGCVSKNCSEAVRAESAVALKWAATTIQSIESDSRAAASNPRTKAAGDGVVDGQSHGNDVELWVAQNTGRQRCCTIRHNGHRVSAPSGSLSDVETSIYSADSGRPLFWSAPNTYSASSSRLSFKSNSAGLRSTAMDITTNTNTPMYPRPP